MRVARMTGHPFSALLDISLSLTSVRGSSATVERDVLACHFAFFLRIIWLRMH